MSSLKAIHEYAARAQRVDGFGLIELMIGIVIGSILLLGIGQVFTASRTAYQTSEGLARAQENSRFAMDYLQRDLRMAGHTGCVNDVSHMDATILQDPTRPELYSHFLNPAQRATLPPTWAAAPLNQRFNISLEGYEANNTGPTGGAVTLTSDPVTLGVATDWTPNLPPELVAAGVVKGSDVVLVRFFDTASIPVTAVNLTVNPATITVPPAYSTLISAGFFYGLADCAQASVFQASSAATPLGVFTVNTDGAINKSGFISNETGYSVKKMLQVYPLRSAAYFVGRGTNTGPALMRLNFGNTLNQPPEELVDGIENLQILYGRDSAAGAPDGLIDTYLTAAQINAMGGDLSADWRRVGTVRVAFISRSVDRAAVAAAVVNPNILGVNVTPPAADGRLREAYDTTIALRNRLFNFN